jgi:hypothetical protein
VLLRQPAPPLLPSHPQPSVTPHRPARRAPAPARVYAVRPRPPGVPLGAFPQKLRVHAERLGGQAFPVVLRSERTHELDRVFSRSAGRAPRPTQYVYRPRRPFMAARAAPPQGLIDRSVRARQAHPAPAHGDFPHLFDGVASVSRTHRTPLAVSCIRRPRIPFMAFGTAPAQHGFPQAHEISR